MSIREDSIIFLLGAGASVDSNIKHAKQMTDDIENQVNDAGADFHRYKDLYNFLKSSIIYQRGLNGNFSDTSANIEDLLNVLSEIKQKHNNKLYPFIGSWNVHLSKVAGEEFRYVDELDDAIRKQLYDWINIANYDDSSYFSAFGAFAKEIGQPLRVFSLNYDLCVEKALEKNRINLELGFGEQRTWEASRFDDGENSDAEVYLYKLHGSIDWKREGKEQKVEKCDTPQPGSELIFGTTEKLRSIDPYLFYVHEFRKYSLLPRLKLIVTVGYSFSDEYINKLIGQSIMRNQFVRVMAISPSAEKPEELERIANNLDVDKSKIIALSMSARDFFNNNMNLDYFNSTIGEEMGTPF